MKFQMGTCLGAKFFWRVPGLVDPLCSQQTRVNFGTLPDPSQKVIKTKKSAAADDSGLELGDL